MTDSGGGTTDSHPSVTVAVVSYFHADVLGDCLESIVAQDGVDQRVVVVDNGAPDGDTAVREICEQHGVDEYIGTTENLGFGSAVNLAFDHAETPYLCTLNPDARLLPGALSALVGTLEDIGDAVTVPKILLDDDRDTISTCGLWNHIGGVSVNQGYQLPADHPDWGAPRRLSGLSGAAFATTAETWERIGGFDEEMFMYKDDVSVAWACHACGIPIVYTPSARVTHRYDGSLDGEKLYHIERGRMLLLAKYLPRRALITLAPTLLVVEALVWAMAIVSGWGTVRGKLRSYRVLRSDDITSIRRDNGELRTAFPIAVGQLKIALPWAELVRTRRVPDGIVVGVLGGLINLGFRANAWVYRRVADQSR